jgi:hypothetical protein
LAGDAGLALSLLRSNSGSAASLLGTGVNEEPDVEPAFLESDFEGTGLLRAAFAGNEAGDEVEGVLWKKPNRVFCPPEDVDFFNAGVDDGVVEALLPMVTKCSFLTASKGELRCCSTTLCSK